MALLTSLTFNLIYIYINSYYIQIYLGTFPYPYLLFEQIWWTYDEHNELYLYIIKIYANAFALM